MRTERKVELRPVRFPNIGRPEEPRPEVPARIFLERVGRLRQRMARRGLDAVAVYGDREHVGCIQYLTNYDPRFEETLLLVFPEGTPILIVGNEGMGYSNVARLPVGRLLYQPFSLLGQPRDKVIPFADLLRDAGLGRCSRVGAAGWKYFSRAEFLDHEEVLDLPDFAARSLRQAVAPKGRVTNETALFMDPESGLRNVNEPEQLADFEWLATQSSANLIEGIRAVRPGKTEMEIFSAMPCCGIPFDCYPVCASGENLLTCCFPSPTSRRVGLGEPMLMTYSYVGSNCCRLGWVASGPSDLPGGARDYVERAAAPYFAAQAAWYETLRVGATGDALHHAVADRLGPLGFRLALNIGHQIAVDEWTHSPVADGSSARIASGMYMQADFFGSLPPPHFAAFAEDGSALADAALRADLAARYPAMWRRVLERRRFMREELGVELPEEVLPFSNLAGALVPFFLRPELSVSFAGRR